MVLFRSHAVAMVEFVMAAVHRQIDFLGRAQIAQNSTDDLRKNLLG